MPFFTTPPLWVWALLALILAVGLRQARGVQQRLWRLLCLPLAWLLGLGAGILLALGLRWGRLARYEPHTRLYHVPGSWLPLALMLGIFGLRYLSAVFAALHPVAAGPWPPPDRWTLWHTHRRTAGSSGRHLVQHCPHRALQPPAPEPCLTAHPAQRLPTVRRPCPAPLALARRVLRALAVCTGVALFIVVLQGGQGLWESVTYSYTSGLSCTLCIEPSRALAARWMQRGSASTAQGDRAWPGWPAMVPALLLSSMLGHTVGVWLGNLITGHDLPMPW